jgi:adenosine/AMP kinase
LLRSKTEACCGFIVILRNAVPLQILHAQSKLIGGAILFVAAIFVCAVVVVHAASQKVNKCCLLGQ